MIFFFPGLVGYVIVPIEGRLFKIWDFQYLPDVFFMRLRVQSLVKHKRTLHVAALNAEVLNFCGAGLT